MNYNPNDPAERQKRIDELLAIDLEYERQQAELKKITQQAIVNRQMRHEALQQLQQARRPNAFAYVRNREYGMAPRLRSGWVEELQRDRKRKEPPPQLPPDQEAWWRAEQLKYREEKKKKAAYDRYIRHQANFYKKRK